MNPYKRQVKPSKIPTYSAITKSSFQVVLQSELQNKYLQSQITIKPNLILLTRNSKVKHLIVSCFRQSLHIIRTQIFREFNFGRILEIIQFIGL